LEGELDVLTPPKKSKDSHYDRKSGGYYYLLTDYFIYLKSNNPVKVKKIVSLASAIAAPTSLAGS
jgi:hypothetical protein